MQKKISAVVLSFLLMASVIACNQTSEIMSSDEMPGLIYVHYYHDNSVKAQPELIDVYKDDDMEQLYRELTSGKKSNLNFTEKQLLESRIMVYHLSFMEEEKETHRKYFLVIRHKKGYFLGEIDEMINLDTYSKSDNTNILDAADIQTWYKINLSN